MIIAWSHAVCSCRQPLAGRGRNGNRLDVRPVAEHHRECAMCDFVGEQSSLR